MPTSACFSISPEIRGILYPVTNVIDTYVYNTLMYMGDIGMSSAASLYQAVLGFILVIVTNQMIRKKNRDYALF